jgi:hypothetical protein
VVAGELQDVNMGAAAGGEVEKGTPHSVAVESMIHR